MNDRPANPPAAMEPPFADIESATRRLMSALDALESAVERRAEADRDEDELATRIQALGADRSRLADELDGSLSSRENSSVPIARSSKNSMRRLPPSVR